MARGFASSRILGLDLARGLAVLGMFTAHTMSFIVPDLDWADPSTWAAIAEGRSAILFAVLAGVAAAILSGGATPVTGVDLVRARLRILVRAALIFALGGLLAFLNTGLAIILEVYAVLLAISLFFLTWSARRLFVLAAVGAIVLPILTFYARQWMELAVVGEFPLAPSAIVEILITGNYPGLTWIVFVLAGLAVGRLPLSEIRTQVALLVTGAGLALLGFLIGPLLAFTTPPPADGIYERYDLSALLTVTPHSGTPFEVVGGAGVALAIIGASLLAMRVAALRFVLYPVVAVGAMSLTAYSVHVVAFWIYTLSVGYPPLDIVGCLWFIGVALVLAPLWRAFVGKGPLENLVSTISRRASAVRRSPAHLDA